MKDSTEYNSFIVTPSDDKETGSWTGDVDGSLWNTRGWTLQERSLSARILHFCTNKIYFECRVCTSSEEGEIPGASKNISIFFPRIVTNDDGTITKAYSNQDYHDIWIRIVTRYSRRFLTKDTDKLPALKGLASKMSAMTGDQYVWGLWKGHLIIGLLWQAQDGRRNNKQPTSYRAPSWSWASLDRPISWARIGGTFAIKPSRNVEGSLPLGATDILTRDLSPQRSFLSCQAIYLSISSIQACAEDDRWWNGSRGTFPFDIFVTSLLPAVTGKKLFAEGCLDLNDVDLLTKAKDRHFAYIHLSNDVEPSGLIIENRDPRSYEPHFVRVGVANVFSSSGKFLLEPSPLSGQRPQGITLW